MPTTPGSRAPFATATAVALGLVATVAAVVLMQASPVWVGLILIGGLAVVASFVFRDQQLYWLAVFLATIPLNIAKMFFLEPEDLYRLRSTYGLIVNEIDIPVLYLSDLPLLVLLALLLAEAVGARKRLVFPKPWVIAAAFTAWCLCTALAARVPLLSVSWVVYQAKYVLVFLVVANATRTRRALRLVVAVLVLGMALQGALSVTAFVRQSGPDFYGTLFSASTQDFAHAPQETKAYLYVNEGSGLLRGSGTVGVSNETAKFIVPLLPLALATAIAATTLATRALYLGSAALGLAGLVCTFSRGGFLAAGVAILAFGVVLTSKGLLPRRSARVALIGGLLGVLLAAPVLMRYLGSRPDYFTMRWDHFRYGVQALFEHALIGVGINNFNVSFAPQDYGGVFREMAVHNHYLRIGVETGVLGVVLYVAFFASVARTAIRGTRLPDRTLALLAAAMLAAFIGVFFYWLDDLFYSVVFNTQLWALAALPFVIARLPAAADESPRALSAASAS